MGKPEEIEEPEEITSPSEIIEISPEKAQEELELFRDMIRGLHVILFAEGGLVDLLIKGGTSEKQAKQVADQLYRWLARRYSTEQLERWDTIFLVAAYGTMAGMIVKKALEHRKKEENKK